ncbi:hypothetical protein Leryth_020835 [Lithospermum erythrorhizon]|nr:hypothetical protein Leryth_020835 [Lithospermum erythrorhizon]
MDVFLSGRISSTFSNKIKCNFGTICFSRRYVIQISTMCTNGLSFHISFM